MEILIPLSIILMLVLLNALFVAAEFSLVGSVQTRLAELAEGGSIRAERVLGVLRDPNRQNRYLATAQIGITVASLGLGMYGEHVVAEWIAAPVEHRLNLSPAAAHNAAAVLAISLMTYLHVVAGEMIPKSLALTASERMALFLQPVMRLMSLLFWPVVFILNAAGIAFLRLLGVPPAQPGSRLMSPDELEYVVEESFAGGLIEAEEQLFIENILDLRERTIGQVMTPRTRITGIPLATPERTLLDLLCQKPYTRYPVYSGSLDTITGILHTKNLVRQQVHRDQPYDLAALTSPAVYVPDSLSLEDMLVRFRRGGFQMAIVLDEYGGTAGLVTLEDVVEEVVGEILDEFDQEQPPIQAAGQNRLRVRGDLLLDELNQLYHLNLIHANAETVGGLMMVELGRMVQPGDAIEFSGVRFEVENVLGLSVQTVLVDLPARENPAE
jgi:CBS domain containing-hemolysin-like protein